MKPPEFLMTLTADVGRVGYDGAAILALVRYMTGLPGDHNGRKTVDGDKWWCATHDEIGQGAGGVHRKSIARTLLKLERAGELLTIPADRFYGDRARAYRVSDQPLAESGPCADQPLAETGPPSGQKRPSSWAESGPAAGTETANLPIPLENQEEHSVGKSARARGTRLPEGWMPDQSVIETMRAECPHVALQAEHTKFVDYWIAKAGKDACKVDWNATWRNWIRRAGESAHPSAATRGRATAYEVKRARNAAVFNELADPPVVKELTR